MKFFGTDQHIYIKCEENIFIGFIKVGKKNLFIYNEIGEIKEINPLCVLDFYTYEGCQRKGYGKEIFTKMLEYEKVEPRKLGYDRPSFKFLNFLKKYYNLQDYVPQNNNFVVFNDYFKFTSKPEPQQNYSSINQNYSGNVGYSNFGNVDKKKKYEQEQYNNTNTNKYYNVYEKENQYENYKQKKDYGNYNDISYYEKFKMPSSSYQYSRTNAEYGAFLNQNQK